VHIEKGMKDGQKILFKNKGDQEPGLEAGDIVIVLDEMENERFTRKDDNLILIMELKLVEALCGCTKYIETLDGRQLVFNLLPGKCKLDSSDVSQNFGNFSTSNKLNFELKKSIVKLKKFFEL
jgi:DnaJ-class molecular chaperone